MTESDAFRILRKDSPAFLLVIRATLPGSEYPFEVALTRKNTTHRVACVDIRAGIQAALQASGIEGQRREDKLLPHLVHDRRVP
jgi:hypothetical protein